MLDWSTCPAVERVPERVSGTWVFRGTRVPVAALLENVEDGAQINQFLEWFPGVTAEQGRAVLDCAAGNSRRPTAPAGTTPAADPGPGGRARRR
jgi:uncharacterized protein (DUF433 family)